MSQADGLPALSSMRHGLRLDVSGLAFGPKPGIALIEDVTFSLPAGARLVVTGPDGSGKSTLLRCLYRGSRPTRGTVRIDGHDIWDTGPREVAKRIAVVTADGLPELPFSARDAVLMGRMPMRKGSGTWSRRDRDVTAAIMERLDLQAVAGRQVSALSGGERHRVMIARALVQEPDMIVLDEPTDRLDARHRHDVLELLRYPGCTVVAAMRDAGAGADFATDLAVLDRGRIVAFGPPGRVPATVRS